MHNQNTEKWLRRPFIIIIIIIIVNTGFTKYGLIDSRIPQRLSEFPSSKCFGDVQIVVGSTQSRATVLGYFLGELGVVRRL